MRVGRMVRDARRRSGLSQRELAERAGVPQPMLSLIERGRQDPRFGTLRRLLRACEADLDIVPLSGVGIDRTQFIEALRLTPTERLRHAVAAAHGLERLRRAAQPVR